MRAREFAESVGGAVVRRVGRAAGRFQEESPLAADVLESDEEFLVVFDAPGVTASDVQVNFADDTVRVRIDRFRQYREGFEMQFPGRGLSMDGDVRLPDDAVVDTERARAELRDDGTLYVFLPKDQDAGASIPVEKETELDEFGVDGSASDEAGANGPESDEAGADGPESDSTES